MCNVSTFRLLLAYLKSTLKTVPAYEDVKVEERKYGTCEVKAIATAVWDEKKGDFQPPKSENHWIEVPASPFYLANQKNLKVIFLDGLTSYYLRSFKKVEAKEGLRRMRILAKKLKKNGWRFAPMSHAKKTTIAGTDFVMFFVSKKPLKTLGRIPNNKKVKAGHYNSVKGMLKLPTMKKVPVIVIPTEANDGLSFIGSRFLAENYPNIPWKTLKIAGDIHDCRRAHVHLKGCLKVLRTEDEARMHFTDSWIREHKDELLAANLPIVAGGFLKLANRAILASVDEIKLVEPTLGDEYIMDVRVHTFENWSYGVNFSLQVLFRNLFVKFDVARRWFYAHTIKHVKNWSTLTGYVDECENAVNDPEEDMKVHGDKEDINRLELGAVTHLLRLFPLACSKSQFMNSLAKSVYTVVRRLTRPRVRGVRNAYLFVHPDLKKGEVIMGSSEAQKLGNEFFGIRTGTYAFLGNVNIKGRKLREGDKLMLHRYPSMPGSLRNATIVLVSDFITGIYISAEDMKAMKGDQDGDLYQVIKPVFGGVIEPKTTDEMSSLVEWMPAFDSDLMNATFSKNIGIMDTMLNMLINKYGPHHIEVMKFANAVQAVIDSLKHKNGVLVDIEATWKNVYDHCGKVPFWFKWLRGRKLDSEEEPSFFRLYVKPGLFKGYDTAPDQIKGILDALNNGTKTWDKSFDHKKDTARWTRIKNASKKVVGSKWYVNAFGPDKSATGKSRYYLENIGNLDLQYVEYTYHVVSNAKNMDAGSRDTMFNAVRWMARDLVDSRVSRAIKDKVISADNTEEFKSLVIAMLLARFWAAEFFCYAIVRAFTYREVWLALRAMKWVETEGLK